jgi:hypothetical protein
MKYILILLEFHLVNYQITKNDNSIQFILLIYHTC